MYTHPVTNMEYKKVKDEYFFKTKWSGTYGGKQWIKSGMKRGFVLLK